MVRAVRAINPEETTVMKKPSKKVTEHKCARIARRIVTKGNVATPRL